MSVLCETGNRGRDIFGDSAGRVRRREKEVAAGSKTRGTDAPYRKAARHAIPWRDARRPFPPVRRARPGHASGAMSLSNGLKTPLVSTCHRRLKCKSSPSVGIPRLHRKDYQHFVERIALHHKGLCLLATLACGVPQFQRDLTRRSKLPPTVAKPGVCTDLSGRRDCDVRTHGRRERGLLGAAFVVFLAIGAARRQ